MLRKVYNLKGAMNFFLNNSRDACVCVKCGAQKECNSYPEAQRFYEMTNEERDVFRDI